MKASELMEELLGLAERRISPTVDTCKAGDPKKQVKRVGTCFIATPNVIARAAAWGADLLITHEPTYYDHWDEQEGREQERVRSIKKTLIEQSGMVLWRWHDHLHERMPDGIIEGQLKALGWKGAYDGRFEFLLEEAQSPRQIKAQLEELGDVLFSAANVSRFLDCDAEEALDAATVKFVRRFREMERLAAQQGCAVDDLSAAELDKLWKRAKEVFTKR